MASPYAQGVGTVGAGAATGAAIGSIVPGIGTAVGALVGASLGSAVGGIAGAIGLGNKAKRNARRARNIQREREQNAQDATYLQMIRRARMARSGSLAASSAYGLSSSSLATSALSSIGSQSQYSVQYTANDQRLVELYNRYMKKAGNYAKAAQTTLATGQLASLAFGVGGVYAGAASAGASASTGAGVAAMEDGVTVGATEVTPAMLSSGTSTIDAVSQQALSTAAYNNALSSGWNYLKLWSDVSTPIFQGISQYNQI